MSATNLKHYIQLDGLRCFAILFVMIGHWISWDTENPILKYTPWGHGVILFFVLSGYLITNILFEQKEKIDEGLVTHGQALKTFYFRRFLRIFPLYYFVIFTLYYFNYDNTREIFPWLVTYTSNIFQCKTGSYIGNFNHFWSLAVEEQFYIIWPFIILYTDRKKALATIVILMAVSFFSRTMCYTLTTKNWMWAAYFTPNLFLPLALGALLAYSKRYKPGIIAFFMKNVWLWLSLVVYMGAYYLWRYLYYSELFSSVLDEYLFAFVCTFFVAKASSNGFRSLGKWILENGFVVFTGKISYGLYVLHLFVSGILFYNLEKIFDLKVEDKHAKWATFFILVYISATLSFYLLEKPISKLKSRFKY